jgi:hypothetical protein
MEIKRIVQIVDERVGFLKRNKIDKLLAKLTKRREEGVVHLQHTSL